MDRAAAEAFLAEPRITERGGKEPFLVAVWHVYHDGRFFKPGTQPAPCACEGLA
jgi:hypothetical protein